MGGLHARRPAPGDGIERDAAEGHAIQCRSAESRRSLDHTWADLGLPDWISRISVFGAVTSRAIRTAAASAGHPLRTSQVREILRLLDESGLLATTTDDGSLRRLRPGTRQDMIETLEREHGDLGGLRRALLGASARLSGSDQPTFIWEAWEGGDWAAVEQFVLNSSSEYECVVETDLSATMQIPRQERRHRPILTVVSCIVRATDPHSGDLDLSLLTRLILQDARELHGGWRDHPRIDAAVVAGSLWMISQASSDLTSSSHELDDAWETHQELEELIRSASRAGPLPSGPSLALFHALSSVVAVLRADWQEAVRHAEPAMLLAPECGPIGFAAASMLSIASFFSGSSVGRERSERFFRSHGLHGCSSLSWVSSMAALPRLLGAINDLDRDEAQGYLDALADFDPARWFDDSMLLHCAAARAGMLWTDPERALAAFDGMVNNRWAARPLAGRAQLVVGRTRVELLLNVGDLNQAADLLETLRSVYGTKPLIGLDARLQLGRGDVDASLSLAEEGLAGSTSLLGRAHLLVAKASAMMLGNSSNAAIDRVVASACVICEEMRTLLPFGMVPRSMLIDLLATHGSHADGQPCFLKHNLTPARIAALHQAFPALGQQVRLTPRERTLLPLLATSDTLGEIADQLFVSINTVRKQVAKLREKLGAKDRRELLTRARELRLLPEGLG